MPPRGSEEYYRNRGSQSAAPGYDSRRGDKLLDLYKAQSEEQQNALRNQGAIKAEGEYNRSALLGNAVKEGFEGYKEGKKIGRERETHDREGQRLEADLRTAQDAHALSEEQTSRAGMERAIRGKDADLLYGEGWNKPKVAVAPPPPPAPAAASSGVVSSPGAAGAPAPAVAGSEEQQVGPPAKLAGPMSIREKQLQAELEAQQAGIEASKASTGFTVAQTGQVGVQTRTEMQTKALAEIENALIAAAGLPEGDPQRIKLENNARAMAEKAKLDPAQVETRIAQAPGKAAAAKAAAATSTNIAVTADDIYKKLDPQISNIDAAGTTLSNKIKAFDDFIAASDIGTGEDAPLAEISAGLSPEKAQRINASFGQGNASSKTTRIREVLVGEIAQLDQQLVLAQAQAQSASPQAKEVLMRNITAQRQKLDLLRGKLQGQDGGSGGAAPMQNPAAKYRNQQPRPSLTSGQQG